VRNVGYSPYENHPENNLNPRGNRQRMSHNPATESTPAQGCRNMKSPTFLIKTVNPTTYEHPGCGPMTGTIPTVYDQKGRILTT